MGKIQVTKCHIKGLCVIEPLVHKDDRGLFFESFNQRDLLEAGISYNFVQENQSTSQRGVIRGLHFQKQFPQAKLGRALRGRIFDVAVDLRADSETFGQWYGVELSEENHRMFLVPEGFAHGLLSLTDDAIFCYKCSDYYHPGDEGGVAWNDPTIGVVWPEVVIHADGSAPTLSDGAPLIFSQKDQQWPSFSETFKR